MRIEAFESRQQGRVDVENSMLPLLDETCGQQPHEAGKTDDVDAVLFKHGLQGALEGRAVFAVGGVVDDLGGYSIGPCGHEPARIRTIRDHHRDFRRIGLVLGGFDEGSHVGASAGDEDCDPLAAHVSPKIKLAVIDDALAVRGLADMTERHDFLSRARKCLHDGI